MPELKPYPFVLLRSPLQRLRDAYDFSIPPSPLFHEGLYLSSPEFLQELQRTTPPAAYGKPQDPSPTPADEKLQRSFAKYWLRSCTRCTPYGTFAGTTLLKVTSAPTSLVLDSCEKHIRRLRLDMNYMTSLVNAISQLPILLHQIRLFPNNSLYSVSGNLRYAEYTIRDNTRHYHLTEVEQTPYLMAVLGRASLGATIRQLSAMILDIEEVTQEEADDFVISMWSSQLLVSELEPCITGDEPLDRLVGQLSQLEGIDELKQRLLHIQHVLQHPGEGVAGYQQIETELKSLDLRLEIPKNTIQTDLFLASTSGTINENLIATIVSQAADLTALSRKVYNAELEEFKARFLSRYEEEEIPLNRALDADIGIGYAGVSADAAGRSELINDLPLVLTGKPHEKPVDHIVPYSVQKYNEYIRGQRDFIEITKEELKSLKTKTSGHRLPDSLYIIGDLLKKEGRLDADAFTFDLSGFGGPSAGNLLARFTLGDPQLKEATKETLQREQQDHPDVVYAEIVHLPQARVGNVLLRPLLRDYEIPYVGRSGAPEDRQIPVDDLMLSIRSNEVILRSRRLNKRIIPRLTTAHNFSVRSLPIYKFLCDVQSQGLSWPVVWDWGHLETLKQLPRVVYKNLVLRKARWNIEERDIKEMPASPPLQMSWLETFRKKWQIPDRVVFKENDNELLIDFKEKTGISLFLHYLRRYKTIRIEEFLFTEDGCVVTDAGAAGYTDEMIIPLYKARPNTTAIHPSDAKKDPSPAQHPTIKRKFPPCSEWLYFKIYCGNRTAENFLKDVLLPFVNQGEKTRLFERFFFIRYRDDFSHLRIRFYNSDVRKQPAVQSRMMLALQPLLDSGLIDKVVVDTYSRELERYGEAFIEDTEKIFYNDSLAVLQLIDCLDEESGKYRLLLALRAIDLFFSDFGLDTQRKLALTTLMQSSYFREFGGHISLQRRLNDKYRQHQKQLFRLMDPAQDEANEIAGVTAIFALRSGANAPIAASILSSLPPDTAEQQLFRLLTSYIHMFMNRLFLAQQRKYELVAYHFLNKYYSSKLAIDKHFSHFKNQLYHEKDQAQHS